MTSPTKENDPIQTDSSSSTYQRITHFEMAGRESSSFLSVESETINESNILPNNNILSHSPPSKFKIIFILLGMGSLFPYNALITCVDWFQSLHPNSSIDIEGQIATSEIFALLITTVALLPLSNTTRESYFSPTNRILFGFISCIFILLTFAILPSPSISLTIILSSLVGSTDAISQSGLYVYASSIHPQCTAGVTFGSAIAGLIVSVLKLGTKWMFQDLNTSSTVFFLSSCVVLMVSICALGVIEKGEKQKRVITEKKDEEDVEMTESEGVLEKGADVIEKNADEAVNEHSPVLCKPKHPTSSSSSAKWSSTFTENLSVYHETLLRTWKPTFSTFLNFFVTLSLFPGTITSIQSTGLIGSWLPIVLITIFNFFDCIGRFVLSDYFFNGILAHHLLYMEQEQGRQQLVNFHSMVYIPTILRIVFFPLIIFCIHPLLITSDILRCMIVSIMALSNGFINCACFMSGPVMVKEDERKRDASSLLLLLGSFLGLTLGAFFGLIVRRSVVVLNEE